jgi:hypothetical protein
VKVTRTGDRFAAECDAARDIRRNPGMSQIGPARRFPAPEDVNDVSRGIS